MVFGSDVYNEWGGKQAMGTSIRTLKRSWCDSKGILGEEMRGSYCGLRIGSTLGIAERVLNLHKDPMPI